MTHGKGGFVIATDLDASQIANRIAYRGMESAQPPRRRLEQAGACLQDAVEELEAVLASLPSPNANGAEPVHEAIDCIMETLRLLYDASRRLETRDTLRVIGSVEESGLPSATAHSGFGRPL